MFLKFVYSSVYFPFTSFSEIRKVAVTDLNSGLTGRMQDCDFYRTTLLTGRMMKRLTTHISGTLCLAYCLIASLLK